MAAKNANTLAAKQRKQKMMLGLAGVALVGLVAFQAPKILGGGGGETPAAAPAPAVPTAPVANGTGVPAASGTTVATSGKKTAMVAGVGVATSGYPKPAEGQLASFTLFDPKDPFVQQVEEETAPAAEAAPAKADKAAKPGAAPGIQGDGSTTANPDGSTSATPEASLAAATISVNGKPVQLELTDLFPKQEKVFVLKSLKPKVARIAVAEGGTFSSGKTIPLKMGKPLTLVNEATGARYTLRLLYTGATPEETATFSTASKKNG